MKRQLFLMILALALAALACNLPNPGTPEPPEPITPTFTEVVLPDPGMVTPTPTETQIPTEPPTAPLPVVYGDRTVDPPQVVLLNPLDGAVINRLDAPDLGYAGNGGVAENSVFFLDADYQQAYRLTFGGVRQELLFLNPDGGYFEGVILPSPDGLRVAKGAVLSFDASGSRVQLMVVNIDGTGETILLDEILTDRPERPTPIKWSNDGQSLYYMNVIEGVEGYGGTDLHKVDLATGAREEIFTNLDCLCTTSISPDESLAVRVMRHGALTMVIRDLATGTESFVSFPEKYMQAWQVVWAPDSSALLLTLGLGNWEADQYSVIHIDMTTLNQTYLITDDPRLLRPAVWPVMETIWLNDTEGNLWRMNASTFELTLSASEAWVIPPSE